MDQLTQSILRSLLHISGTQNDIHVDLIFFLNDHGLALLKQDNAKALVDVLMEEIATAEAERDSTEASL